MKKIKTVCVLLVLGLAFSFVACESFSLEEKACKQWKEIIHEDSMRFLDYKNDEIYINDGKNHIVSDESGISLNYNGGYAQNIDPEDISFSIGIFKLDKYISRNLTQFLFSGAITQEEAYKISSKLPELESSAEYYITGDIYVDEVSIQYRLISFKRDSDAKDFNDWHSENYDTLAPLMRALSKDCTLNKNEISWMHLNNNVIDSDTDKIEITNKIIQKIKSASGKLINMKNVIMQ